MSESETKARIHNILLYFVIFMVITVDSSFFTVNIIDGKFRVAIDILVAAILSIYKKNIRIDHNYAILCTFIMAVFTVIGLATGSFKQVVILDVFLISAFLLTSTIDLSEFADKYSNIVLSLAVFSLITFLIYLIAPDFIRMLPTITRAKSYNHYYNAFLSIVYDSNYVKRNFGIFWEPGAFAIFLNVALFFELFHKKIDLRRITVLTVTVLTTLSTTGIVCTIVLFIAVLFKRRNKMNKYLKIYIIFVSAAGIVYLLRGGDYFIYHVFGKLSGLSSGATVQTTFVRINSIIYPGWEFLHSPVWGVGFNRFLIIQEAYCMNMATCTFINWLAIYGILGGVLPIIGVVKFFSRNGENLIVNTLLFLFSFLLFSTENFVQIEIIYLFLLYGILKEKQCKLPQSRKIRWIVG